MFLKFEGRRLISKIKGSSLINISDGIFNPPSPSHLAVSTQYVTSHSMFVYGVPLEISKRQMSDNLKVRNVKKKCFITSRLISYRRKMRTLQLRNPGIPLFGWSKLWLGSHCLIFDTFFLMRLIIDDLLTSMSFYWWLIILTYRTIFSQKNDEFLLVDTTFIL